MAFNMMEMMSGTDIGQSHTFLGGLKKPEYMEIDLDDLDEHPDNEEIYNMNGLETLAESIKESGLQQPILVAPKGSTRYVILSGHRRFAAYCMLREEYGDKFSHIPCRIRYEADEKNQKLDMLEANITIRKMSDWEEMLQCVEYEKTLISLKRSGRLKGSIRTAIAEKANLGNGTVGRYLAIYNNLTNEYLRNEFKEGRIGISVAYELSGCSEHWQAQAEVRARRGNIALTLGLAKEFKKWTLQEEREKQEKAVRQFEFEDAESNTLNNEGNAISNNPNTLNNEADVLKAEKEVIEVEKGDIRPDHQSEAVSVVADIGAEEDDEKDIGNSSAGDGDSETVPVAEKPGEKVAVKNAFEYVKALEEVNAALVREKVTYPHGSAVRKIIEAIQENIILTAKVKVKATGFMPSWYKG